MSTRRILWSAAGAGALALMAAGSASADTLSAQTRIGNFTFSSTQGQVNVPVAPGLFVSPAFAYIQGERVIVSYTAECAVAAANNSTWLDLEIQARNITTNALTSLPPTTGSSDALCTSNGTAGSDGWQMNAVNAVANSLPTGIYRIEVRARLSGTGSGHLGDSSLVIWK